MSDWMDDIRDLEKLRNESLLTPEEYDRQRNIIMDQRYETGASIGEGSVGVSGWARLGAALLEALLGLVTLGIGWVIWACTLSGTGQTPAKKLLNQTVLDLETNAPMTLGKMLGMRWLLGGVVATFAIPLTIYVIAFMPFWDKRNQNLWDKVSNSLVITTPNTVI